MPNKPCVAGCSCGLHSSLSIEDRFWSKVDQTGDCWLWTSTRMRVAGYGQFKVAGKYQYAHRVAYELSVGNIPDELQIDHRPTCPKSCVNPTHLRVATGKQNAENKAGPQRNSSTGVRGVTWDRNRGKYLAKVRHDGKTINVGRFNDLADAEAAVIAKRNELFTHNDLDRVSVDV